MLHCQFDNPTIAVRENGTFRDKAKPLVCCANGFAVNKPSAKSECPPAASRRLGPPPLSIGDANGAFDGNAKYRRLKS